MEMLCFCFGFEGYDEIMFLCIEDIEFCVLCFVLFDLFSGWCMDVCVDCLFYSYGKVFCDFVCGFYGCYDNFFDYVVYFCEELQLFVLMEWCLCEGISFVLYGGGSSVVGGVEFMCSLVYVGVIIVDMCYFDVVFEVDEYL